MPTAIMGHNLPMTDDQHESNDDEQERFAFGENETAEACCPAVAAGFNPKEETNRLQIVAGLYDEFLYEELDQINGTVEEEKAREKWMGALDAVRSERGEDSVAFKEAKRVADELGWTSEFAYGENEIDGTCCPAMTVGIHPGELGNQVNQITGRYDRSIRENEDLDRFGVVDEETARDHWLKAIEELEERKGEDHPAVQEGREIAEKLGWTDE